MNHEQSLSPAQRLHLAEEELAAARENDQPRELALALARCALRWEEGRAFARATEHYDESLSMLQSLDDKSALAQVLTCSAETLAERGLQEEALERSEQALRIFRERGTGSEIAGAISNLANLMLRQKRFQDAIQLLFESYQLRVEQTETTLAAGLLMTIALALYHDGQASAAKRTLREARDLGREAGFTSLVVRANDMLRNGALEQPYARWKPPLR